MSVKRAVLVTFAVAITVLPARDHQLRAQGPPGASVESDILARDIIVGLGFHGDGYFERVLGAAPHASKIWGQVDWPAYNAASGAARAVFCQIDSDLEFEVVIGLSTYPGAATGGYLQVKDDETTGYAHLRWLRLDWPAYNEANGETFPACGDVDGDTRDEIVIGLGYGGNGYLKILEDANAGFVNQLHTPGSSGWLQVGWAALNDPMSGSGRTHPSVGNLDNDVAEEIAVGYGHGGNGFAKVLNDGLSAYSPMSGTVGAGGWIQLDWNAYNTANTSNRGNIWPAIGDMNNDGKGELVLGLGPGGAGWLQIRGDNSTAFAPVGTPAGGWVRVDWPAYNTANGSTYPSIGDVDGDLSDELVVGLGTHFGNGGYFEVIDDLLLGAVHKSWGRVHWPAYNSTGPPTLPDGTTKPSVADRCSGGGQC